MSKLEGMYFNHILDLSIKKVVAVVFFPRAKNRKLYPNPPPRPGVMLKNVSAENYQ